MNNKRLIGTKGEELAAGYLEKEGMRILFQNYHTRFAELDIVAKDADTLVFVEVKARKNTDCGFPGESLTKGKIRRICHGARLFCMKERVLADCQLRFDVVEILGNRIRHIRNAFEYIN